MADLPDGKITTIWRSDDLEENVEVLDAPDVHIVDCSYPFFSSQLKFMECRTEHILWMCSGSSPYGCSSGRLSGIWNRVLPKWLPDNLRLHTVQQFKDEIQDPLDPVAAWTGLAGGFFTLFGSFLSAIILFNLEKSGNLSLREAKIEEGFNYSFSLSLFSFNIFQWLIKSCALCTAYFLANSFKPPSL